MLLLLKNSMHATVAGGECFSGVLGTNVMSDGRLLQGAAARPCTDTQQARPIVP